MGSISTSTSCTNGDAIQLNVTVTYLRLAEGAQEALPQGSSMNIQEVYKPDVAYYRFLYNTVGQDWIWWRKRIISDQELAEQLSDPATKVFVFYRDGQPFGYFDLDLSNEGVVDIAYFGLLPFAIGKGYGKEALAGAIRTAARYATTITLNTCSVDHPRALDNYLKAGFTVVGTETQKWLIPSELGFDLSSLDSL